MLRAAAILAIGASTSLALAATTNSPTSFAGIKFGSSVGQLKAAYPEATLNPDSDRTFLVYQVPELHGVTPKSPASFSFYDGKMVGAQILLGTASASYWLENSKQQFGAPDSCDYCDTADMASARWKWPNGTVATIEGGGMLNIYTAEGQSQRQAWIARGERGAPAVAAAPPPSHAVAAAAPKSNPPVRKASHGPVHPSWFRERYRAMVLSLKKLLGH